MPRPRQETLLLAALGVFAFAWAWLLSSDFLAMKLNWDTARYVGLFAGGQAGWSREPWNSHFALGPIYWIGRALVWPFGGGFVDGVRVVGALALSASAVTLGGVVLRLTGRMAAVALWTGVYVCSWGVAILVLTLEDNVLYLPWAVGALAISLVRISGWRARDSLFAGACVGCGVLVSWQAGLYLCGPLYVAVFLGGAGRGVKVRLRDVALLFAGFFALVFAWVLFYAATADDQNVKGLLGVLFSRPEPSFFPESWHDVSLLLRGPRRIFRNVGTGLMQEAGAAAVESRVVRGMLPELGLVLVLLASVGALWATWKARKTGRWELQFCLMVFLGLTLATSFYVDLPTDKYKRFEYLPLLLCLIGAALSGRESSKLRRWAGTGALVLVLLVEMGSAIVWAREHRQRIAELQPPGYFGREQQPWFVYFRRLRTATPDRCLYVFAFQELQHGRFQQEIPAGLWDALPDHLVLGDPESIATWPVKIKVLSAAALRELPVCAWRSELSYFATRTKVDAPAVAPAAK